MDGVVRQIEKNSEKARDMDMRSCRHCRQAR